MNKEPLDLNGPRWTASLLAVSASLFAAFDPDHRIVAVIVSAIASTTLAIIAHVAHVRNGRLKRKVSDLETVVGSLEGAIGDMGGAVEANHPMRNVAAGIMGQGELATMNYGELVERLRSHGAS